MRAELEARVFIQGRNITRFPLDMQDVVSKLGLKKPVDLIYSPRLHNDIDAMIYESESRLYISVNAHRPETRQRFTIAHEIGHLYLEHEPVRINGWDEHEEWQEIEANEFAASLLMPASRVYTLASYHRNILHLLDVTQKYFDVSMTAAAKRITQLDIFRGAIILGYSNKPDKYFEYYTSDFYEDSECRYHYKRNLPRDKVLHVLVAETYRHVVRMGIG